ncbi:MAG TPA: hypothetical protein VJ800_05650, partial [Pseudolabrys sp.]|nr:hypothetical protein [Pseudolabrys sp.]
MFRRDLIPGAVEELPPARGEIRWYKPAIWTYVSAVGSPSLKIRALLPLIAAPIATHMLYFHTPAIDIRSAPGEFGACQPSGLADLPKDRMIRVGRV